MPETPLMKQYKSIKSEYQDSILFFRLGEFYEMFFEDAKIASKELGLTLTSRNKEKNVNVPLAGVPCHTVDVYISKLVAKGYKVAICEQTEDPKASKGIVKREVVKVVTPGTVIDIDTLEGGVNNYLLSLKLIGDKIGLGFVDITTGEFKVLEIEKDEEYDKIFDELNKIEPKEILIEEQLYSFISDKLEDYIKKNDIRLSFVNKIRNPEEVIQNYFNIVSLESFGLKDKKVQIEAAAILLDYVLEMQKDKELTIEKIESVNNTSFAEINSTTRNNLELTKNQREKTVYGSLLWVLNKTKTSMGTRLLKKYINNPLLNLEEIESRQYDVQFFIDNILLREDLKDKFDDVYDLERLVSKIIFGNENGKDLVSLKKSVEVSLEIMNLLKDTTFFDNVNKEDLQDVHRVIDVSINEDAPFSVRQGNIIKRGYNQELDDIHKIMNSGKEYLLEIEQREKKRTGIKNMKIKYNKIFGYFIEITNSNLNMVPEDYIRKQTLSNAERYITPELKKYEDTIINSKSRIEDLEYYLFKEVSSKIKAKKSSLVNLASKLAYLDIMISFAVVAVENNYSKPEMHEDFDLEIKKGRHPVVERLIPRGDYISNDVKMSEEEQFVILTGPNMSGKSTYMKQVALISIMAQIGSFVPAEYAKLPIVDKFLTRIGASDDILSGQSTFMVEMSEVSSIVNNATKHSLIILDEVGRGTSTFDGVSIATAVSEYIYDKIGAKTIFATHYHELTDLEIKYKNMSNYRIEVQERGNKIIFLRKIVKGGADKSYGIEVARLAGLPKEILVNSKKMLKMLEKRKALIEQTINTSQLSLFDNIIETEIEEEIDNSNKLDLMEKMVSEIENADVYNMTPMDALKFVSDLKSKLEEIE